MEPGFRTRQNPAPHLNDWTVSKSLAMTQSPMRHDPTKQVRVLAAHNGDIDVVPTLAPSTDESSILLAMTMLNGIHLPQGARQ